MKLDVILFGKRHLVVLLRLIVGRIAVKNHAATVHILHELYRVLVFDHHVLQASGRFGYQGKVTPHVVRLCSEGVKP